MRGFLPCNSVQLISGCFAISYWYFIMLAITVMTAMQIHSRRWLTHGSLTNLYCAVHELSGQSMDHRRKHESMLPAAQSMDCANPCFAPNKNAKSIIICMFRKFLSVQGMWAHWCHSHVYMNAYQLSIVHLLVKSVPPPVSQLTYWSNHSEIRKVTTASSWMIGENDISIFQVLPKVTYLCKLLKGMFKHKCSFPDWYTCPRIPCNSLPFLGPSQDKQENYIYMYALVCIYSIYPYQG